MADKKHVPKYLLVTHFSVEVQNRIPKTFKKTFVLAQTCANRTLKKAPYASFSNVPIRLEPYRIPVKYQTQSIQMLFLLLLFLPSVQPFSTTVKIKPTRYKSFHRDFPDKLYRFIHAEQWLTSDSCFAKLSFTSSYNGFEYVQRYSTSGLVEGECVLLLGVWIRSSGQYLSMM